MRLASPLLSPTIYVGEAARFAIIRKFFRKTCFAEKRVLRFKWRRDDRATPGQVLACCESPRPFILERANPSRGGDAKPWVSLTPRLPGCRRDGLVDNPSVPQGDSAR